MQRLPLVPTLALRPTSPIPPFDHGLRAGWGQFEEQRIEQWQMEWAQKGEERAIAYRKMLEAVLNHCDTERERALQKEIQVSHSGNVTLPKNATWSLVMVIIYSTSSPYCSYHSVKERGKKVPYQQTQALLNRFEATRWEVLKSSSARTTKRRTYGNLLSQSVGVETCIRKPQVLFLHHGESARIAPGRHGSSMRKLAMEPLLLALPPRSYSCRCNSDVLAEVIDVYMPYIASKNQLSIASRKHAAVFGTLGGDSG